MKALVAVFAEVRRLDARCPSWVMREPYTDSLFSSVQVKRKLRNSRAIVRLVRGSSIHCESESARTSPSCSSGISCRERESTRVASQVYRGTHLVIACVVVSKRLVVHPPDPAASKQLSLVLTVLLVARQEPRHASLAPLARRTRRPRRSPVSPFHRGFGSAARVLIVREVVLVVQVGLVVHVELAVLDVVAARGK